MYFFNFYFKSYHHVNHFKFFIEHFWHNKQKQSVLKNVSSRLVFLIILIIICCFRSRRLGRDGRRSPWRPYRRPTSRMIVVPAESVFPPFFIRSGKPFDKTNFPCLHTFLASDYPLQETTKHCARDTQQGWYLYLQNLSLCLSALEGGPLLTRLPFLAFIPVYCLIISYQRHPYKFRAVPAENVLLPFPLTI